MDPVSVHAAVQGVPGSSVDNHAQILPLWKVIVCGMARSRVTSVQS